MGRGPLATPRHGESAGGAGGSGSGSGRVVQVRKSCEIESDLLKKVRVYGSWTSSPPPGSLRNVTYFPDGSSVL
eukprot:scaffold79465_cov57-Phaeocystis_antarctica.AAC.2